MDLKRYPAPPSIAECSRPTHSAESSRRQAMNLTQNLFNHVYAHACIFLTSPPALPLPELEFHHLGAVVHAGFTVLAKIITNLIEISDRTLPPHPSQYVYLKMKPVEQPRCRKHSEEQAWMNYYLHICKEIRGFHQWWDYMQNSQFPIVEQGERKAAIDDLKKELNSQQDDLPSLIQTINDFQDPITRPSPVPSPLKRIPTPRIRRILLRKTSKPVLFSIPASPRPSNEEIQRNVDLDLHVPSTDPSPDPSQFLTIQTTAPSTPQTTPTTPGASPLRSAFEPPTTPVTLSLTSGLLKSTISKWTNKKLSSPLEVKIDTDVLVSGRAGSEASIEYLKVPSSTPASRYVKELPSLPTNEPSEDSPPPPQTDDGLGLQLQPTSYVEMSQSSEEEAKIQIPNMVQQAEPPRKETISSESWGETHYSVETVAEPPIRFPIPMYPARHPTITEEYSQIETPIFQQTFEDLPESPPRKVKRRSAPQPLVTEWLAGLERERLAPIDVVDPRPPSPTSPRAMGRCRVAHPCGCRPLKSSPPRRTRSEVRTTKPLSPKKTLEAVPPGKRDVAKENEQFLRSAGRAFEGQRSVRIKVVEEDVGAVVDIFL